MGIAITNRFLQDGQFQVRLRFAGEFSEKEQAAGAVLGYRSREQHYVMAQLGAGRAASKNS